MFFTSAHNLRGPECEVRREQLCSQLQDKVEVVNDDSVEISQALLLQLLDMSVMEKSRLTRAIKHSYPQSKKKKVPSGDGKTQYPYKLELL